MLRDACGLELGTDSAEALAAYDAAVRSYLEFRLDAIDHSKAMLEADPECAMSHCLRGILLTGLQSDFLAGKIGEAVAAAEERAARATPRERLMVEALRAVHEGDQPRAILIWDRVLVDHPHDLFALRLQHNAAFLARPQPRHARRHRSGVPGLGREPSGVRVPARDVLLRARGERRLRPRRAVRAPGRRVERGRRVVHPRRRPRSRDAGAPARRLRVAHPPAGHLGRPQPDARAPVVASRDVRARARPDRRRAGPLRRTVPGESEPTSISTSRTRRRCCGVSNAATWMWASAGRSSRRRARARSRTTRSRSPSPTT